VKQEVPFRSARPSASSSAFQISSQLEVEDVSAAHAEEVRMDFAGADDIGLAVAGNGTALVPTCSM
jgi:hypothetical protein